MRDLSHVLDESKADSRWFTPMHDAHLIELQLLTFLGPQELARFSQLNKYCAFSIDKQEAFARAQAQQQRQAAMPNNDFNQIVIDQINEQPYVPQGHGDSQCESWCSWALNDMLPINKAVLLIVFTGFFVVRHPV